MDTWTRNCPCPMNYNQQLNLQVKLNERCPSRMHRIVFNIFVEDIDDRIRGTLSKLSHDTKLSDWFAEGMKRHPEGPWDGLWCWPMWTSLSSRSQDPVSMCPCVHVSEQYAQYPYRLWYWEKPCREGLGILKDEQFDIKCQWLLADQKVSHILSCTKGLASRIREVILRWTSFLWESTWSAASNSVVAGRKKTWTCLVCPEEDYENSQGAEPPLLWSKAERVWILHPGEQKAARRLSYDIPIYKRAL